MQETVVHHQELSSLIHELRPHTPCQVYKLRNILQINPFSDEVSQNVFLLLTIGKPVPKRKLYDEVDKAL